MRLPTHLCGAGSPVRALNSRPAIPEGGAPPEPPAQEAAGGGGLEEQVVEGVCAALAAHMESPLVAERGVSVLRNGCESPRVQAAACILSNLSMTSGCRWLGGSHVASASS